MKVNILDIVSDTFTNTGGLQLFNFLESHIENNNPLTLSFKGSQALSSSFLNSSIGDLVAKYGFEAFKRNIKPIELTKTQADMLKYYFETCGIHI